MIAQLNKLGLKPEDISHVIMSHMHMDHIGNIDLFKDTAEFYVARKEAEYAFATVLSSPYPEDHGFYSKKDVLTEVKKLHYIDEECELFKGIETILLPGHTPGVMGLLLHLSSKKIILTSDALNARKNYEGTLPGVIYDSLGFFDSLEKIKKIEKKHCAEVWFGHDMEQFNNFEKTPNYYE
jgi:glyoxylase-like metal-dependent hydrolase (beta-lactamase superfamily II)